METVLDIGEVARRTGLTLRGLRFYEARGLVKPLRTEGGRRVYGAGELARLSAVVALKRAGFSLAQIGAMLGGRQVDLGRLVAAQIEALDAQAVRIQAARTLLLEIESCIDRREPIDVATLCSLIEKGSTMDAALWQAAVDRNFTPETQAGWRRHWAGTQFDPEAYRRRWADLSARIEESPLDPASPGAQALLDEWCGLLAEFAEVATPEMRAGVQRVFGTIAEGDPGPQQAFIDAAIAARRAQGGEVDVPDWVSGAG